MNNPVRAYERSKWRSAGYRLPLCVIVWKTGFYNLSRLSDADVGRMPATPHFVPTALVQGYYISGHKAPQIVRSTIFHPAWDFYFGHKNIKTYWAYDSVSINPSVAGRHLPYLNCTPEVGLVNNL